MKFTFLGTFCEECGGLYAQTECLEPNCSCHSGPNVHESSGEIDCPEPRPEEGTDALRP